MNHDDNDNLWELLGRARPAQARPAFVQDVLRAVRMAQPEREAGFVEWLRHGWNWLALAGAAAVVLFVALSGQPQAPTPRPLAAHEAAAIEAALANSDFTVVNNLDVLLALDDSNAWLDSSLR
ncbi:MAG: hypothetical protein ABMA13_01365 [Chthoniobacteraceae bacterium]